MLVPWRNETILSVAFKRRPKSNRSGRSQSAELVRERDRTIRLLQAQLQEQSAWAHRLVDELAASGTMVNQLRAETADRSLELKKVRTQIDLMARRGDELAAMLFATRDQLPSVQNDRPAVPVSPTSNLHSLVSKNGTNGHPKENGHAPGGRIENGSHASSYRSLVAKIRDAVRTLLPPDAIVLAVSKGDEELLDLPVRAVWHFPRDNEGGYTGYYPADSSAAVNHLEQLRLLGAEYLLFPGTAVWWLDYYDDFRRYLDEHYCRMPQGEHCLVYHLVAKDKGGEKPVSVLPKSTTYDVVCFPIIDWNFRFQRPQQLTTQFAQDGHRCYYFQTKFGTPTEPLLGEEIAPGVYCPRLPGPAGMNLYQAEIDERALEEMLAGLDALRQQEGIVDAICVVQLPFWAPWPWQRANAGVGRSSMIAWTSTADSRPTTRRCCDMKTR